MMMPDLTRPAAATLESNGQDNPHASGRETAAGLEPGVPSQETIPGEKQLADAREKHLRLAAEFENYKKRATREREQRALELKDAFLRDLLPIMDNLDRALAGIASTADAALYQGIRLTVQQLYQLLSRHGLEPEDAVGQTFDPHRHDAVGTCQDPAFPDQAVVKTWQRGWKRGDRCFRPALVVVNQLIPPSS